MLSQIKKELRFYQRKIIEEFYSVKDIRYINKDSFLQIIIANKETTEDYPNECQLEMHQFYELDTGLPLFTFDPTFNYYNADIVLYRESLNLPEAKTKDDVKV